MESPCLPQKFYEALPKANRNTPKCVRPKIVKNLVSLCTGTLMLFTAYDALTMLQSTMNRENGVGVISQATLYFFFCGSAILLPKFCISRFGSRNTSMAAMFAYLPYIASNYYPHWSIMIPSSILLGLAGPLLWASHGVYLNGLAVLYSSPKEKTAEKDNSGISNKKDSHDAIAHQKYLKWYTKKDSVESGSRKGSHSEESCRSSMARSYSSNALFEKANSSMPTKSVVKARSSLSIHQGPSVHQHSNDIPYEGTIEENETKRLVVKTTASLFSSTVAKFFGFHGMAHLTSHVWSSLLSYFTLRTDVLFEEFSNSSCSCGAEFCSVISDCFENNAGTPEANVRFVLTSICLCLGMFSILIIGLFMDSLDDEKRRIYFSFDFLNATCAILKRNEMLLLIPLSIHTGLVQGFYVSDFNKAYVACAWGTYHVGLVAACYGVACGASSILSGWCVRRCGRRSVFASAALVNVISIVYFFVWTPDSKLPRMFFFASGLWGIHVGIVWSQLRAFYGVLFKSDDEAAFSAFHLWSGFGFCIAFGFSNFFCIFHKLYVVLAVSVLGFSGYFTVEWIYCKKNKDSF